LIGKFWEEDQCSKQKACDYGFRDCLKKESSSKAEAEAAIPMTNRRPGLQTIKC
jgi:hypothetical protein